MIFGGEHKEMKTRNKILVGVAFIVLIVSSLAFTFASPLKTADQIRERGQDRLRDPTSCSNCVDTDADGICDNCPKSSNSTCQEYCMNYQFRHMNCSDQ